MSVPVYKMPPDVSPFLGYAFNESYMRLLDDIAALGEGDESEAWTIWQCLKSIEQQVQDCVNAAGKKVMELNAGRES